MTPSEKILKLREWDDAYHNAEALIPDEVYDALKLEAQLELPDDPYFTEVGAPVRSGKEPLPVPMGSLTQKYDDADLTRWVNDRGLQNKLCVIAEKLDGFSCLLVYKNGKLSQAFSRGTGLEGASVLRHVQAIALVPKNITVPGIHYIRGEIIMKPQLFEQKYKEAFANPRNMVSGCMNRTTTENHVLADMEFLAHEWITFEGSKQESIQLLQMNKFVTPYYEAVTGMQLATQGKTLIDALIAQFKADSDYELDGVVITIDDLATVENLSRSSSLNPEHSIKFKLQSEGVRTECVAVHWEPSKNFLGKPRIEIKPVQLSGVTITFATGHNAKFIVDNAIGPGAILLITRQGDVIPYCKAVIQGTTAALPTDMDYEWSESGVEIVLTDKNHPEVIFKQVLDFFTSLEVDLLKEASLRLVFDKFKLMGLNYTEILVTIIDLTKVEWEHVIGANGAKIHTSLHRRLQNLTMPILMGSLNYCGVGFGIRKATKLLEQIAFKDITSVEDIAECHGFDVKTAEKIWTGIPKVREFLNKAAEYITFRAEEVKSSELAALVVVMTGFRDKDLHAKIESLGGKVGSSVSSKTTHLLTLDPTNLTTKLKAAKDKGVTIMSPEQFKDMYNL
jgi:DNA ligase (NAD+)